MTLQFFNFIVYYGSLKSEFAKKINWGEFRLAILASASNEKEVAELIQGGLEVYLYTHPGDEEKEGIPERECTGVFFDLAASISEEEFGRYSTVAHKKGKKVIANAGWGSSPRVDFLGADYVLFESFIGSHTADTDRPFIYYERDLAGDLEKLRRLLQKGHRVLALSYGPSNDINLAERCMRLARDNGAAGFCYAQVPLWEADSNLGWQCYHVKEEDWYAKGYSLRIKAIGEGEY